MRFALRDLSNQYISASYQDVLQKYVLSPTSYVLDGYGTVFFTIPSSSIGNSLITSDQTIPSASYSLSSSNSISSSYTISASYIPFRNITTISANYIVLGLDYTIIVTGSSDIIIYLPSSSNSQNRILNLKNRLLNYNMYIKPPDAYIDDNMDLTSSFKNTNIKLQCSGSTWFIL